MFKDLVIKNRSYRRFNESHRIPEEQLKSLVELARLSPCAANLQTLRYCLISEPADCDKVFPHLKWANYLRFWEGPVPGERPSAYIIILAPVMATRFLNTDAGIAAQSMLLGATEMGLGGCIMASVDKTEVHHNFDLPHDLDILLVIALGEPAETVVIEEVTDPEDIEYWRDEEGIHHVPKRKLQDLIIK